MQIFSYLLLILSFIFGECLDLKGELELVRSRRQSCQSDFEYRCRSGECIDSSHVCDGQQNCRDASDEKQSICSTVQCPYFSFRCTYGACVQSSSKCDGKQDCADNSDELLPECNNQDLIKQDGICKDEEFLCTSGECVDEYVLCDGKKDCKDGSDESIAQCVNIKCPHFTFQCAYGGCISDTKRCDGVEDCSDGSDEDEDICQPLRPTIPKPVRPVKPQPQPQVPTQNGDCTLPDQPDGGRYLVKSCARSGRCNGGPETLVPSSTILSYHCHKGFTLSSEDRNIFCFNGVWEPEPPECHRQCKALVSNSLNIDCIYKGDPVDCDRPLEPLTRVRPTCKPAYHVTDSTVSYIETKCLTDGTLETPLFKCAPDCGKQNHNTGRPVIAHASPTEIGEFPWHTALYTLEGNKWNYSCGGTIISPFSILTAAHCVHGTGGSVNKLIKPTEMKVAVGKYKRSWDAKDKYEQKLDVKQIIPQKRYKARINSYEQDIAIIDLVKAINFSFVVSPVCMDWQSEGIFTNGMLGTVAGWGLNEKEQFSDELQMARLEYYDYDTCKSKSSKNFLHFLTYDKFCAGLQNGTSVQPGDSGGGLTFIRDGLHYVYGVVSIKPTDRNTFATFTNITDHIVWLEGVERAVKQQHLHDN